MFGQALKAALTAVSKDSILPILNQVKVCPGAVYATDRYRLVRSRYHLHTDYEDYPFNDNNLTDFEPFLIPADIAKTLVKLDLKNVHHNTTTNTITLTLFDPKTPALEQSVTLYDYDGTETSFPNLEKLLSDAETEYEENIKIPALQDNQVVLNYEFLAAWPKRVLYRPTKDNHAKNMTVRFTAPNKPVLFYFSDHFTGLLMPIRIG